MPDQSNQSDQRTHVERATELGFEALARQSREQILWLGASPWINGWRLPVLNDEFLVDTSAHRVTTSAGRDVNVKWRILALHYLAIDGRPERLAPEITFPDLATARSYTEVYRQRTIGRLCAMVGDGIGLAATAAVLGGRTAVGGDAAFDFDVFPRLGLRLIWHAPDDEFPSSATLLLPANIEAYLCSEDIVVLSECLVSRLTGRPF